MFGATLSLAQAFVKSVFFKHHSVHLLNVRDSLSGIRAIVSHICCSIHQSQISFVSLFSLVACIHLVNGRFRGCIINHDLDMLAMSQGTE